MIDLDSGVAILDGKPFCNVDKKVLAILQVVANAKGDIKIADAVEKIGCNHPNTFHRWKKKLPDELRECIVGITGVGLRLVLPVRW